MWKMSFHCLLLEEMAEDRFKDPHRTVQDFEDFRGNPDGYRRGILLPQHQSEPKWVWLKYKGPTLEHVEIGSVRKELQAGEMTSELATVTVDIVRKNKILRETLEQASALGTEGVRIPSSTACQTYASW